MSSLLKTMSVAAVGVASIAICYFGYQHNSNTQYQNRVSYADTVVDQDDGTLGNIENEINGLFSDETKIFLRADLTEKQINALLSKLDAVKTTGEEFGIEDEDLPKGAKKLGERKTALQKVLTVVSQKFKLQQSTSGLFTSPVPNYQEFHDDLAIIPDLKITTVGDIRERLSLQEDDAWRANVIQYLDSAQRQVENIQNIDHAIAELVVEGKATDKVNAESVASLQAALDQVRDPEVKSRYDAPMAEIHRHLGEVDAAAEAAAAEAARQQAAANANSSYEEPTYNDSSSTNNNYYQPSTPDYGSVVNPTPTPTPVPTPTPTPTPDPVTPDPSTPEVTDPPTGEGNSGENGSQS